MDCSFDSIFFVFKIPFINNGLNLSPHFVLFLIPTHLSICNSEIAFGLFLCVEVSNLASHHHCCVEVLRAILVVPLSYCLNKFLVTAPFEFEFSQVANMLPLPLFCLSINCSVRDIFEQRFAFYLISTLRPVKKQPTQLSLDSQPLNSAQQRLTSK